MTRFAALLCFAVSAALSLSAEPLGKPRVVASFLPLYCFTANVAGDRATVETLLTGAVSPHDYQFSPQDMRQLNNADLFLTLGLGFEPWVARVRSNVRAPVVEVAVGLKDRIIYGNCGHDHAHDAPHAGSANPHVWLDPQLAMVCVSNVSVALTSLNQSNATHYAANAKAYVERLALLDREIAEALRPFAGTAIITYHDALPYFTRRYGLTVAAVVQPVPEVNPSIRRIAELRKLVRDKNVKALLVDANARPAVAERIGKEFRIPIVPFDNMETGTPSPDAYEKVMRSNMNALTRALK